MRIVMFFVLSFTSTEALAGIAASRAASDRTKSYLSTREGVSDRAAEARERAADAHLCVGTGGVWRENLLSCHCAPLQIFSGQRGCREVQAWRDTEKRKTDGFQTMSLHDFDNEEASGSLQDQQMSSRYPEHLSVYLAGHSSLENIFKQVIVNIVERPLDDRLLTRRSAISAAAAPAISANEFLHRCIDLVDSEVSCRSLVQALGEIRGRERLPYRLAVELNGYLTEDRISTVGMMHAPVQYVIASTNGVPSTRMLVHNVPQTLRRLVLLLAPDGSVVAGGVADYRQSAR